MYSALLSTRHFFLNFYLLIQSCHICSRYPAWLSFHHSWTPALTSPPLLSATQQRKPWSRWSQELSDVSHFYNVHSSTGEAFNVWLSRYLVFNPRTHPGSRCLVNLRLIVGSKPQMCVPLGAGTGTKTAGCKITTSISPLTPWRCDDLTNSCRVMSSHFLLWYKGALSCERSTS